MIKAGLILKMFSLGCGSLALGYNLLHSAEVAPLADPLTATAQILSPDLRELASTELQYFFYKERVESEASALGDTATSDGSTPQEEPLLANHEQEAFSEMNARRGEPLMTQEEFLQARYTPSAIQPIQDLSGGTATEQSAGKEPVHISRDKLETLFPGDEMYIHSKQLGYSLIMVVDQVQDHRDGTLSWIGHLKNLAGHYEVRFTQGPQYTLADIETPNGRFHLQAQGEAGWIVAEESRYEEQDLMSYLARAVSFTSLR